MIRVKEKTSKKLRHERVRKKVKGTAERPRLSVFRSLSGIYAQVIDDQVAKTMASASSLEQLVSEPGKGKTKTEIAQLVGLLIAQRAKDAGITQVVFDRGGYQFHGRVKALAEAARAAGLEF